MSDEMDHGRYKFLISPTARSNVRLTIFDPLSASGSFPESTLRCTSRRRGTMRRVYQLLVLSGVMIASLTEIEPASAQSANFRLPGCRSFLNQDNGLRYDFSGGVCPESLRHLYPWRLPWASAALLRLQSIKGFGWLSNTSPASPLG